MYCFTLVRSSGFELELVRLQLAKGVGIFDCDEAVVFSDKRTYLQAPTSVMEADGHGRSVVSLETHEVSIDLRPIAKMDLSEASTERIVKEFAEQWRNAPYFVECWKNVFMEARYKFHDWVVKSDADAAFFPARLRAHLSNPKFAEKTFKSAYVRTCEVTPLKCVFEIKVKRQWGNDIIVKTTGEDHDSFSIGTCDGLSDAGRSCKNGGWGGGVNTIVNQHGDQVGIATCCSETNEILGFEKHCPQDQTPPQHSGISGSLEAYTRRAIDVYGMQGTKCLLDTSYMRWGEEHFMQDCMEYLQVEPLEGSELLKDRFCNGRPKSCSGQEAAFHPMESLEDYFDCASETLLDMSGQELHPDLLEINVLGARKK